jgi:hypothetical protein
MGGYPRDSLTLIHAASDIVLDVAGCVSGTVWDAAP